MSSQEPNSGNPTRKRLLTTTFVVAALGAAGVAWLLTNIMDRKQEARNPTVRVAELTEISVDPKPWGLNWPHHYDGYLATAGDEFYGGAEAMPESKLDHQPWLRRLYAGYAFSIDYREARGHAYMLYDQGVTERITQKPQAGACMHCHASTTVLWRKAGLEAMGQPADDEALAADFNMPAVIRGFQELSRKPYQEVLAMLYSVPDGTPEDNETVFPAPPVGGFTGEFAGKKLPEGHVLEGNVHPVTCIDCHNPTTMELRVTRPGLVLGLQALATSDEPVPHLPSIERWRRGSQNTPYDVNKMASQNEMRSYVCAQCHVEYYCATSDVLEFPWGQGLKHDQLEAHWAAKTFPDGTAFFDYKHGETGAKVFKAQHPEFELWSQGVHAQNGVSCSDCHMPYQTKGGTKMSDHRVDSPLNNINNACLTCHNSSESELLARVNTIQQTTVDMRERAGAAVTEMFDAIMQAKAAGATDEQLAPIFELQSKAMWRVDYISSENSKGFHAPQEAMRALGEALDYSRKAQAAAMLLWAPEPPSTEGLPTEPIQGVTPRADAGEAPGGVRTAAAD